MDVRLAGLTKENWEECARLGVREDQQDFVDSNLFCIAESRFESGWEPLAVYRGEVMVGMVVLGMNTDGADVIEHLMIDGRFQGRGSGRAALLAAVDRIRPSGANCEIRLSYWPGNPAVGLYESVGFRHTGERWGEEPVMAFSLKG